MIIGDQENYIYDGEQFDYIIVGGGTLGLFVTSQLENTGKRILVLESGIQQFSKASHDLNHATQIGRKHNGIEMGRARTLGGTATLWGGQLARFTATDFSGRSRSGIDAWPVRFEEMTRCYKKAGDLLGLKTHEDTDESIAQEIGAAKGISLRGSTLLYTRWLRQPNFAVLYGELLRRSRTITVITGAMVTRLVPKPGSDRVCEVCVHRGALPGFNAKAGTVIIANGTFEAVRLLLNTQLASPQTPWLQNNWIGLGFQDHLDLLVGSVKITDDARFRNLFENVVVRGEKLQPKLRLSVKRMSFELAGRSTPDIESCPKLPRRILWQGIY